MRTIAGDTDFLLTSDVHSAEQTALALQSLGRRADAQQSAPAQELR